jgi:uncharacterized cofD-like protein
VKGISEAVAGSRAVKVYVCNVMTQPGETSGFSASDHVRAVIDQAGRRLFDYVLVNREAPSEDLLKRYGDEGAYFVHPDIEKIRAMGLRPVVGDYISQTDVVRHDPRKLAQAVLSLAHRRMPVV